MLQETAISPANPNATNYGYNGTPQPRKAPKRWNKSDLGPDFVAPDGGWGWIVCIAASLSTFSIYHILELFGLLYFSQIIEMGLESKQLNSIFEMQVVALILIGIMNGTVFHCFTFRQVALTGGLFVFIGIALTAFCRNFIQYSICFFLYGIGFGLNTSATTFAVYTYFNRHRRIATGFIWTITGLGPIIFAPLLSYLLQVCGDQVTLLITAAVTLITLPCGIVLKPVLHHGGPKLPEIYNGVHINLQSRTAEEVTCPLNSLGRSNIEQQNEQIQEERAEEINIQRKRTFIQKAVKFFELRLLCDLTFMNLLQGMVITKFSLKCFQFLTYAMLHDYDFTHKEISWALSLMKIADIILRFVGSLALDRVAIGNSTLFAFGIVITIIARFLLTIFDFYYAILGLCILFGFGNAFCTVFGQLVIPSYVPLHQLPAALGFQMAIEAFLWFTVFPIVVELITNTFGYSATIYFTNVLSILSLALWIVEWLLRRKLGKPKSHTQQH